MASFMVAAIKRCANLFTETWSIMHRRCRGSRISRTPFWLCWGKAKTGRSLGRSLPANFIACSALLAACSRVRAAASRSVLTPTSFYPLKNICL